MYSTFCQYLPSLCQDCAYWLQEWLDATDNAFIATLDHPFLARAYTEGFHRRMRAPFSPNPDSPLPRQLIPVEATVNRYVVEDDHGKEITVPVDQEYPGFLVSDWRHQRELLRLCLMGVTKIQSMKGTYVMHTTDGGRMTIVGESSTLEVSQAMGDVFLHMPRPEPQLDTVMERDAMSKTGEMPNAAAMAAELKRQEEADLRFVLRWAAVDQEDDQDLKNLSTIVIRRLLTHAKRQVTKDRPLTPDDLDAFEGDTDDASAVQWVESVLRKNADGNAKLVRTQEVVLRLLSAIASREGGATQWAKRKHVEGRLVMGIENVTDTGAGDQTMV